MCGFTGFWTTVAYRGDSNAVATAMANCIAHRGPDDSGVWSDADAGIALAHRRLAIVDLSAAGHQPMLSASGRWVLVYNGEVYNHLELRKQLESTGAAPSWRGHSDTETLLACIEAWGVDETLKRSVGMFALALWDRSERALWLARDRIGEKPLYYGWQGDTFLFGSELKALRAHPAFRAAVDRGALALLLRHNYVPGPYSIYAGIKKLAPGTWLKLRQGERDTKPIVYWSLAEVAERGTADPFQGSEIEALDELERVLGNAVQGQMVADVPLGALLSGGVDSTLVTALMQARSSRPVRTFTIGFHERAFDEAGYAHQIAAHLGTEHTELYLSAQNAMDLISRQPEIYDEPFADSSQLPTYLVMKLARQHVTVALSGDAGDEFFGGYNRYMLGPQVWRRMSPFPPTIRQYLGSLFEAAPADPINRAWRAFGNPFGIAQLGTKLGRIGARLASVNSLDDLHVELQSEWNSGNPAGQTPQTLLDSRDAWPALKDPVNRMMALDALTYLPGDILTKVDRAAMAVSLETRAPFLDRDVVEFAWTLPISMKLHKGKGKWLLRQLLDRHVPRALIERPKQGFGIPLEEWLRGPLREWAESMLSEQRLRQEGYLDPTQVRDAWKRLQRGDPYGYRLWSVLMFQVWLDAQADLH